MPRASVFASVCAVLREPQCVPRGCKQLQAVMHAWSSRLRMCSRPIQALLRHCPHTGNNARFRSLIRAADIEKPDVRRLAELAHIQVTDEEVCLFAILEVHGHSE
jgi:hypothetical protein